MAEQDMDLPALRALLPLAANGSLDPAQRAAVDDGLRRHPELLPELRWLQALRDTVQAVPLDPLPEGDLGWSRLAQRLAAERASAPAARTAPAWLAALRDWLQAHTLPVLATACALLVAQGVIVAALLQDHGGFTAAGGAGSGDSAPTTVRLHVTVRPDISEARWREALQRLQASVVDGPDALGIYTLRLPVGVSAAPREQQAREAAMRLITAAGDVFDSATPADPP